MPERVMVPVDGRCPNLDQQLENRLPIRQAAFITRKLDAQRLCGTAERNPKGRMKAGPETGELHLDGLRTPYWPEFRGLGHGHCAPRSSKVPRCVELPENTNKLASAHIVAA